MQGACQTGRQSAITNHIKSSAVIRWIISVIFFIIILDIMGTLANAGTASLTWSAPTTNTDGTSLTDLSGYKVYYGTTTGVYNTPIDVGNVTTTTISNLTDDTTYYFAVTAYDTMGNESSYSNEVSKFMIAPDVTAPDISGISAGSISAGGAIITWNTDEVSTSQIEYGTSTSYGSSTPIDNLQVTSHSVTLGGLTALTTYHFRVKSQDAAGNLTLSSDNTFMTAAPPDTTPPVISNIGTVNVTTNSATIIWTTDEASTSIAEYGEDINYGNSTGIDNNLVTSHSVTISGLSPNTPYYFRIASSDQAGNQVVSTGYNLTTQDVPQPETPSPIRDLRIQAGTATRNSVILEWTATGADGTQGTASSYDLRVSEQIIIEDGLSPATGKIYFSDATRISDLPVPETAGSYEYSQVSNLRTNTAYYFAVKAVDEKGNYSAISNVINEDNYPPQPVTALRNGFTIISIPLQPSITNAEDLLAGIVGSPVEIYSWSSTGIGDASGDFVLATTLRPGYGYFLKAAANNAVLNIRGTVINEPGWTIPLQPGWNMIGNPYPQEVVLRNTYIRRINTNETINYEDAVANGWISNASYSYNGSTYNFEMYNTSTLKTWQGYWIAVLQDGQYELVISRP